MSGDSSRREYRLLEAFRKVFEGNPYYHRNSTVGDLIASFLYEDLVMLNKSARLVERVRNKECVVNASNKAIGKRSRRGDGTFGELVPGAVAISDQDYAVARGHIANIQIGAETKILAKAMIKQIDRVIGDLVRQVEEFRATGGRPICVGLAGINYAQSYTSYEGEKAWPTDGKKHKHPFQEAADAESRITRIAAPKFDEFQILRFRASNVDPFPFEWVNYAQTELEYAALLLRISREYDARFP